MEYHKLPSAIENESVDWVYKMLDYSNFRQDYEETYHALNIKK